MPELPHPPAVPHFKTAQYAGSPDSSRCALCSQTLGSTYYRVRGSIACEACATKARSEEPTDKHSAFARALLYGIGAAILGLILYSAFSILTGIVIGYASLAVGYLVGKAMKLGSQGAGGRRYQITAVLLTYAAVSLSFVPIAVSQAMKHKAAAPAQTSTPAVSGSASDSSSPPPDNASSGPAARPRMAFVPALLLLIGFGLISPFYELQNPVNGAIGLLILFIGMRFAWQLTAGTETPGVLGPFRNQAPQTPS